MIFHSGEPGKKTFMYFSSEVGKGFIISDDEEVTGVISVRNPSRKNWNSSIQESSTITDTLQKRAKRKQTKKKNVPNFLFVNKPHYSSNSSIEIALDEAAEASIKSENMQDRQRQVEPKSRARRYRSEVMLSTTSRLVA